MQPFARSRSPLAIALGLALGLALAGVFSVTSCGPKQAFCPDAGDGVCHAPVDAGPVDTYEAPAKEMGSVYVGSDSGAD